MTGAGPPAYIQGRARGPSRASGTSASPPPPPQARRPTTSPTRPRHAHRRPRTHAQDAANTRTHADGTASRIEIPGLAPGATLKQRSQQWCPRTILGMLLFPTPLTTPSTKGTLAAHQQPVPRLPRPPPHHPCLPTRRDPQQPARPCHTLAGIDNPGLGSTGTSIWSSGATARSPSARRQRAPTRPPVHRRSLGNVKLAPTRPQPRRALVVSASPYVSSSPRRLVVQDARGDGTHLDAHANICIAGLTAGSREKSRGGRRRAATGARGRRHASASARTSAVPNPSRDEVRR
ncbi:hypothetical protein C8J57DRAFT_1601276 [Mycena rebaudengoi]|nr:hypothetical protein C8J57DRAFT_1601276 [Mycena rebaudengoi]